MRIQANRRRRRGFTVLELVISTTLGAVVLSSAVRMVFTGRAASDTSITATHLDEELRRGLDRATEALRPAQGASVLLEASSDGAPEGRLVFETFEALPGGGNALIEHWIELVAPPAEPWNGLDDDGDGLVDEGRLVWIRDPAAGSPSTTLCDDVARAGDGEIPGDGVDQDGDGVVDERGLELLLGDGGVLIRVSVEERTDDGGLLRRAAQRWIRPRN